MKKFLVILMVVAMAAFLFVGCEPTPATYTLTMAVNPTGGGTTTPAVGAHPGQTDGTVVNIAATPATGYKFVNWTGDVADLNSASTTVTMDAAKTVTANFELELIPAVTYDLTMQVSPTGSGTTTPAVGTHNYASGAVVNISATPVSDYKFVNWTGDVVADLNSASTTVTMDADKTVTANFEELPTNVPIITEVSDIDITSSKTQYINKVAAAGGIKVHGTGPTYAEIRLYFADPAGDVFAGTGDVTVTGAWTVDVAESDLGEDGEKILYATAKIEKTRWTESPGSNKVKFTLDTKAPTVKSVKARGGQMAVNVNLTYNTMSPATGWAAQLFYAASFNPAQLLEGEVEWKIEILSIVGGDVTLRVHNLTAGTFIDYGFPDDTLNIKNISTSWIPGARVWVCDPTWSNALLNPVFVIGAYCLITTNTPEILGRVSLTFDEDVSTTAALGGTYVIINVVGWGIDILDPTVGGITSVLTYDETTDTIFWEERIGFGFSDIWQYDTLVFEVSDVTDLAGNPMSTWTGRAFVLAPTASLGP